MVENFAMDGLQCPASPDSLQELQSYVQARAKALGVPAALYGRLALVMEELAVNVMHYAYPDGQGNIKVGCRLQGSGDNQRFCVQLRDQGRPFNPLTGTTPDTSLSIEERPIGGLGIFLALEMTDSIDYAREGESNVVTFCFDLPSE